MQGKIIILSGMMGIDINDAKSAVFIGETIKGIDDLDAFIEYCRDKKEAIEYATKTEKLDTLATMYKKLQANAKLPHETAMNFSKQLTHKVEQARTFIKNQIELGNEKPFSSLVVDGHSYFTDKEIKALSGLGRSSVIVELSEQHKLEDSLMKLFLSKYISRSKYEALNNSQKEIRRLVGGLT